APGCRIIPTSCKARPGERIEAILDGGTRVLIVDDHAMLRDAMRAALELRPSVVLMDVSMPGPDGIEVTRRLCTGDAELGVIIVTMHANPALVARAVRAGASAYLTKDFSMQDIVAAVETVAAGDVVLSPNLAGSMLRELTAPPHVKHDLITKREADALRLL